MARDDDPRPLSEALAGVHRELGLPAPEELTAVLEAWPDIVGADLVGHAEVRALRDRELVVAVDDPAYATAVRYLETAVCDAAARAAGRRVVDRLRVVVQPPGKPRGKAPV